MVNLDRLITIQERVIRRDEYGAAIDEWVDWRQAWARKDDKRGQEFFASQADHAELGTAFRIRWVDGLQNEMRIIFEGVIYDIKEIREVTRRHWLDVFATAWVE